MQGGDLQSIFKSFANGKPDMESKQFSKLVKECKLIDKKFTNNDVDIVFAKVKVKGTKTISFGDFERALEEIAKKKKHFKRKYCCCHSKTWFSHLCWN